jgi:hypothetical protein
MTMYSSKLMWSFRSAILALPAVLAIYASASADIQRRELETEVPLSLGFASGKDLRCGVTAWDEFGLEGSCGSFRWRELKAGSAFGVLKAIAPAKETEAVRDALTVLLALPDGSQIARLAVDWAKRQGVAAGEIDAARAEAAKLVDRWNERARAETAELLARTTPEGAAFAQVPWTAPTDEVFERRSDVVVEATRALLARAGGSATLHATVHVVVFVESDDEIYRREAAALETVFMEWSGRLAGAGAPVVPQARVPVVFVTERDRWRQLVVAAFGGDPAAHPESVVVYLPIAGSPAFESPVVLVAPEGDRNRARYAAFVGLSRAILHYTESPARPPAFLNEGLPRVMADVSAPRAGMDIGLRAPALRAIRGGGSFVPLFNAGYADEPWRSDRVLAQSLSYIFVRWLWDNDPDGLLRLAKGSGPWLGHDGKQPAAQGGAQPLEPFAARFSRVFRMTPQVASDRARAWFRTND